MNLDDLRARFRELQPISGVPWMFNILGCGLMLYGVRDEDPEFRSFVKTRYLCVLGIPLLALGAYRIVRTDSGWLILGREPISTPAAWLNIVVLLAGFGGGAVYGVHSLITSPWYVARRQLQKADGLFASGQLAEAAELYEVVAAGPTDHAAAAVSRLTAMVEQPDPRATPGATVAVFHASKRLLRAGRWPKDATNLFNTGMARVNSLAASEPRAAVLVLEAVTPLAPKGDDTSTLARDLLERVVATTPDDLEMVSRLAVLYEAQNMPDRCTGLLVPRRAKLGSTEGARVLGQIDARAGRIEPALALLRAYTRPRLDHLREVEADLKERVRGTQDRIIAQLKSREVTDFDYEAARNAGEEQVGAIVASYVNKRLKGDPDILRANQNFEDAAAVAPVALDLGMLLLQHAQGLPDPDQRKRELAEAEATFLSVQRIASESPEYQLSLGQVYYWEGKSREGRAEFDKLLAARNRDPKLLLAIANVLREIGSTAEARVLSEEGYRTANDPAVKKSIATLRGLLEPDLDTRIDWLEKGDSTDPLARAILCSGLGMRALHKGDEAGAVRQMKEAVRLYEGLPDGPETLNNASIVLRQLGGLTGDEALFERAAVMIERAAALDPGNSLTLTNAAGTRLDTAMRDVIGSALDLKLLKQEASLHLLVYLYDDQAGRDSLARRVATHPGVARFLALQQKVMLLAPRNPDSYSRDLSLFEFTGDTTALRDLRRRVAELDLDLSDDLKVAQERVSGEHEARDRELWASALKRSDAIAAQARSLGRGPTFALAIDMVVGERIGGLQVGLETDRDRLVSLAEEAASAAPSAGSRGVLIVALLARAEARLVKAHPQYATIFQRTRRSISVSERVAALLSVDGPLTRLIADDPDIKRATELLRSSEEKLPNESGVWSWAMLRVTQPETAARVARSYAASEADHLSHEIHEKLEPYEPRVALDTIWVHAMAGRSADVANVLKVYTSRGLPLPMETP